MREGAELLLSFSENSSEFRKGNCLLKPPCFQACVSSWMAAKQSGKQTPFIHTFPPHLGKSLLISHEPVSLAVTLSS